MRILHISTRLILGGSQENTVLSCEGQSRLGHEVHLAFGPIYGPEGSLLERVQQFRTDDGRVIATHVVPHMRREVKPWADRAALRELEALIAKIRPDIVHTHSSKAGILGRMAAWNVNMRRRARGKDAARIGIVHTIHGPPFMPVEGSSLARLKVRVNNLVYTLAERHAAGRCHVTVSVADAMTRTYLERGIGAAVQYVTVRSGMEVGPYLTTAPGEDRASVREGLGLAAGDFVVGTVARLAQHKGHDDLLEALADELKAKGHWKLLWVGDGWWRERLVAKATAMGLKAAEAGTPQVRDAHIVLTGLVPPTRVPALIRAMDVLAHPSYREGLPRTVPQALLCGVCPVAYDVDGTGEACREMQTGRLVPVGNRAMLREAIVWCAEHEVERLALAQHGQAECAQAFSAERMVQDLEAVYARAVAQAPG